MLIATFGTFTFYQVGNQAMIQRMLAAQSALDALMGLVLASFLNFFRPLVTCFLGLAVYHWINVMHQAPPLAKGDLAFTFALGRSRHPGACGHRRGRPSRRGDRPRSAHRSTPPPLVSTDIYKKLIHPAASDREMVRVGRTASFIVLLLAAVISPVVGCFGIFKFFQFTLIAIAIPFMATTLMALFWKRVNYPAAVFGLLGGVLITAALLTAFSGRFHNVPELQRFYINIPELHFFYIGGIAEVIIVIGIAAVALAAAPPDPAKVAPYMWSLQVLPAYDEGQRRPWYQQVKFWWAIIAVIWFYLYWKFW